jgi:cyclophilin family peptidyl-prolyl cis-trans isomerase
MVLQFKMLLRLSFLTLAVCALASAGWCQEDANSDPAENTPPAEGDAAAAEGATSPADAYAAKLDEWRSLLKEMRKLKGQYEEGDDDQLVAIQKQWDQYIAQGEQLIKDLRGAGMRAFAAAPNEDRQLTRFLIKILDDDIDRDSFENAAELSRVLLDNGCDVSRVFLQGGVAAFCTNDFGKAEQYLKEAEDRGSFEPGGNNKEEEMKSRVRGYAKLAPQYATYWKEEQAIRQKEAEADDLPRVKITTNKGAFTVELFENEAPETVANFISLVDKGYYNGLVFHRVIKGFMAQTGCPKGDGTGGPGYNIRCECVNDNYRKHFRGTLSMAHAGRDSGGSQFFSTFAPTAHLNGEHTAFGRVIEGIAVLSELQRTEESKGAADKIVEMEVLRKRPHEYVPTKVQ